MEKMIFMYQIKYLGKFFPANTELSVKNEDVKSLISEGGKVLEKDTKSVKKSAVKRGLSDVTTRQTKDNDT